jgi:hypothetical protein
LVTQKQIKQILPPSDQRVLHYTNLTRGLLCPIEHDRFVRIQSTWGEQKRWGDTLFTLGPDFLMNLALGHKIVLHDKSEKKRRTRAQYQCISWIKYACSVSWFNIEPESYVNGHNATGYWRLQWMNIDPRVKTYVSYFKQYTQHAQRITTRKSGVSSVSLISLIPCSCHIHYSEDSEVRNA